MNAILLAFAAGTALFQCFSVLPDAGWLWLSIPVALLWRRRGLRPLVGFVAGLCWGMVFAQLQLNHRLPPELEGRDLLLEGEIASLPASAQGVARFEMEVLQLTGPKGEQASVRKVMLNWYDPPDQLEAGQQWRLMVRLKRPHGMRNPAGFDYAQWLFTQRVAATGYVREWQGSGLMAEARGTSLQSVRQAIAEAIDRQLEPGPVSGLVKALSLGDRRTLSRQDWRVFSRTGTSHLIAISGLHVGLAAGWCWFLGQWFWRRSERLVLRLPAQRAGAVLGLLGAFAYAGLAGFSLPTQRALVMVSVALGGVILAQSVRPLRSLTLALFLLVLFDPTAPLTPGFWLSFGAVGLILVVLGGRLEQPAIGWRLLRIQAAVSLGLMPLLFIHFGEASLIAPLVNLLLVPWFSLVLVPMSLIGLLLLPIPALASAWYGLLGLSAGLTFDLLQWFSQLPLATVQMAHLPLWLALGALLGGLLLLLPAGMPGRPLGLLLLAPLLFVETSRPRPGEFWFTLLDVGQGLACVVQTNTHVMIYDTGPAYGSGFSTAEAAILPYLSRHARHRIDRMVVSNGDSDHAGGVEVVASALQVDDLLSGEAERVPSARPCRAGESWSWDGVAFQVLHPENGVRFRRSNDNSCILRITNGLWSLLLTGDIELQGESSLLATRRDDMDSDILVAPHHGSATSSSDAFVAAVEPAWVLFSTGYRNRYGFPKAEVVERWRMAGAQPFNSAETGAISFYVHNDERPPVIELERERHRRYWDRW
ncbi:MAG: DNA internalization-related competence protein ComEC/Rec2 [Candidatus Thiodiazotropha sp.]